MIRECGHARVLRVRGRRSNAVATARRVSAMSTVGARLRIATALTGAGAMDYGCVRRTASRSRRDRTARTAREQRVRANCVDEASFGGVLARVRIRIRIRVAQQTDGAIPRSRFVRAHAQVDASRARDCAAVRSGAGGARRVERAVSRRSTRARAV